MADDLGPAASYCWLSLPRSKPNAVVELAGAAYLLSAELVVTCAHVVRDHLGFEATPVKPPQIPVTLRFPGLDIETKLSWCAVAGIPMAGAGQQVCFVMLLS